MRGFANADARRHDRSRCAADDVGVVAPAIRGDHTRTATARAASPARARIHQSVIVCPPAIERANAATPQTGFQRAGVAPPQTPPLGQAAAATADDPPADAAAATDGFLINGSVNNGAASPFAQPAAFGNNRRRAGRALQRDDRRPLQQLGLGRQAVFAHRHPTPRPDYYNVHLLGTFGGPVKVPRLQNRLNVFVGFQRLADDNALDATGADADGARALRQLLAEPRRVGPPGADRRSGYQVFPSPATRSLAIASARRQRRCSATTRSRRASGTAGTTTKCRSSL